VARGVGSVLARTMRLALILALNCAAAYALWLTWPRAESLQAAAPTTAETAPTSAGTAPSARPAVRPSQPLAELSRALRAVDTGARAIVARWTESARQISQNKVHAGNVAIAVCVRELGRAESGEVDLGAARSLLPASNLKLVTTAAALTLLGPDWEFQTRVEGSGPIRNGVLEGDLVLRAAGDPLFDPQLRGDCDALFEPLLARLSELGVTAIQGDLVLDEGAFADPTPAPGWPSASQHWAEYCALSGGFSVNRGCLHAHVTPTSPGQLANVGVFPRGHGLVERFGVRSVADKKNAVNVGANATGVTVSGQIPARSGAWDGPFAAPDPVALFGNVLHSALERRGIVLGGRLVRRRHAPGGTELFTLRTPLWTYLDEVNAQSTNAVADQLLLAMGNELIGEGTREAGARATRDALAALGVSTEGFELVDGSGLSRGNRVSARQIVALLDSVAQRDAATANRYVGSLATPGRAGTLDDRMTSSLTAGRVRAKTGYINGVSALSGYVERDDGRTFVFSILVNYPHTDGLHRNCWRNMQDEICELLASVKA